MMNNQDITAKTREYVMNTYTRWPVAFARGQGMKLWDVAGKEYIDFVGGIAVCCLGHAHPSLAEALSRQARTLIHTSNLYHTEGQADLAERLINLSYPGKVFFANSGAEANEGAVKLARKYAKERHGGDGYPYEVITAENSFHGRTLAMLAATGQKDKQTPFEPLPVGFRHVPFNDLGAMEAAVSENTCAIMLEPIQGEAGVNVADKPYLEGVRSLCDERGLLLILDEVQTGIGRTGKWFAYEHYEMRPDIMTLAKGLGGGVPIGAIVAIGRLGEVFQPGDHGTTFGGSPLVCAAAHAVLDTIENERLVEKAALLGDYLQERLRALMEIEPSIVEIRGKGLLVAIELAEEVAPDVVDLCMARGVLTNKTGPRVIRLTPPLIVSERDIDLLIQALTDSLADVKKGETTR